MAFGIGQAAADEVNAGFRGARKAVFRVVFDQPENMPPARLLHLLRRHVAQPVAEVISKQSGMSGGVVGILLERILESLCFRQAEVASGRRLGEGKQRHEQESDAAHLSLLQAGRGRDANCSAPPAQIRTGAH